LSSATITAVIVISNLEYGGAQRQVVELANHIDPRAVNLHICSLSGYVPLAPLLKSSETRLHVIEKKFKFDLTVVPRLARLLRLLNADIVHGYLFDAEIAARLGGRIARVTAIGNSERNTDYPYKKRQLAAYRATRSCVDFYVANSNAGARFNQGLLDNPPGMYYTIHNGVDTVRFRPGDKSAARRELGLDHSAFVIGMFGSYKRQKNHELLFRAMRAVLDRYPEARLLLVGDELAGGLHGSDAYKSWMLDLVRSLGLEGHCIFAGNRRDVEHLYVACDVTALPSIYEGTPNVALESMACGIPVAATRISDNSYVIRDGQTGLLSDPRDVDAFGRNLLRLADDNILRETMGAQARKWVEEEFSCTRLVEKTIAVYLNVLGAPAPGAARLKSFSFPEGTCNK
jgi:glycosyltransferase involved in cell wall biosynthesis